jgi:hypothetical protein
VRNRPGPYENAVNRMRPFRPAAVPPPLEELRAHYAQLLVKTEALRGKSFHTHSGYSG